MTSAARFGSRRSPLQTVRRTVWFAFGKPRLTLSAGGDKEAGGSRQVVLWLGEMPGFQARKSVAIAAMMAPAIVPINFLHWAGGGNFALDRHGTRVRRRIRRQAEKRRERH